MKPLIYEPKCIIYEYKSSLFTFYALSLLFFSTAKVIRISQPHNKKIHFRAFLLCKRLHRQLALELPPPLYLIKYNRGGQR